MVPVAEHLDLRAGGRGTRWCMDGGWMDVAPPILSDESSGGVQRASGRAPGAQGAARVCAGRPRSARSAAGRRRWSCSPGRASSGRRRSRRCTEFGVCTGLAGGCCSSEAGSDPARCEARIACTPAAAVLAAGAGATHRGESTNATRPRSAGCSRSDQSRMPSPPPLQQRQSGQKGRCQEGGRAAGHAPCKHRGRQRVPAGAFHASSAWAVPPRLFHPSPTRAAEAPTSPACRAGKR